MTHAVGLGVSTNDFHGDLDRLARELAHLAEIGADFAEFGLQGLDIVVGARPLPDRLAAFRRVCAGTDLRLTLHAPNSLSFMDEPRLDLHRAIADALVAVGAEVGAEVLVLHTGRVASGCPAEEVDRLLAIERDRLYRLGEKAAGAGMRIGLENLNAAASVIRGQTAGPGLDPRVVARQVRETGHPAVGMVLDFAHAAVATSWLGIDYPTALREAAPAVTHLHLNDCFGLAAVPEEDRFEEALMYGMNDLHLPLGWGALPFETVMPTLEVAGPVMAALELRPRFRAEWRDSIWRARALVALLPARPGDAKGKRIHAA